MLRAMTRLWLKVASERDGDEQQTRNVKITTERYQKMMCSTKLHAMLFYFSGMQHKP